MIATDSTIDLRSKIDVYLNVETVDSKNKTIDSIDKIFYFAIEKSSIC